MAKVNTNEFRKRLKILIDNQPYEIIDNQFVKPGKGQAFNRVKIKNLLNGRVIDRTWKSGEMVDKADVTSNKMEYLYNDGTIWSFMDQTSFETIEVPKVALDGQDRFLLDNTPCEVLMWNDTVIEVELPNFMHLLVTDAPPGARGDTTGHVTRPGTLETGAEIQIPLFINEGMKIKVDTRTGEYVERSKE